MARGALIVYSLFQALSDLSPGSPEVAVNEAGINVYATHLTGPNGQHRNYVGLRSPRNRIPLPIFMNVIN